MAKILIIGRGNEFNAECDQLLKRKGHRVAQNNDVFEALREATMDGVDLILWDAPVNDPGRARKFAAIKRYHRFIPLIILDDDNEPYFEHLDDSTVLMSDNSSAQQVFDEIIQRVPEVIFQNPAFESKDVDYVE